MFILPKNYKKSVSWSYATGRIRSLETGLMGKEGQDRLFAAPSEEAISYLLPEYGYNAGDIELSLDAEKEKLYELFDKIAADKRYPELILSFTDGQNLKTLLKEKLAAEQPRSFADMSYLMLRPSLIEPSLINDALQEDDFHDLPEWISELADKAAAAYSVGYDAARIDLAIDRGLHERAKRLVKQLSNPWFEEWLAMRRDLINLETLFRTRLRKFGAQLFEDSLLPEGKLSHDWLKSARELDAAEIEKQLNNSFYHELSRFAKTYGESGTSSDYSSVGDAILMRHIYEGGQSLNGPEVTLAYIFGREMEMKNIRIALSALRNHLPSERVALLRRGSYPEWR